MLLTFLVLGTAAWRALDDYFREIAAAGETHRVGDWLINYADGFVRRGLFGQLLYAATSSGRAMLAGLVVFQLACYGVVLWYALGYLARTRFSWSAVALVCAPVGLPFIGWDPLAGWRKEIMVFAAIVLLAWAREAASRTRIALTVAAILLFGLAMFSWETSIFGIPVMLYLLRRPDGRPDLWRWPSLAILGLGGLGGLAAVAFRGTVEVATEICRSVVYRGINPLVCAGAIDSIGWLPERVIYEQSIRFPQYLPYFALLPLALLPVLLSGWLRRNWPWFLAFVAGAAPLYVVGQDYGRWHYLLVVATSLAIMSRPGEELASRFWGPVTTVAYVALWGLPHWMYPGQAWPRLGLVASLLGFFGIEVPPW